MRYLKSAIVGIASALVAAVLWVLAVFVLPVALPLLISRFSVSDGTGGIGATASISSGSILAAALVGFVVGFVWTFRRTSKASTSG